MKYWLSIILLGWALFGTAENDACDLFESELAIVQDQMDALVEDVATCKKLLANAAEEKNKMVDEKIRRLITNSRKQANLISHSVTQISLHKECACEGFDFELTNQKIIEVKYWIKRAEAVDISKQKAAQYEAMNTNILKLDQQLATFSKYISDPCKAEKPVVEELPDSTEKPMAAADTLVTDTTATEVAEIQQEQDTIQPVDTIVVVEQPEVVVDTVLTQEPVISEVTQAKDTVSMDTMAVEIAQTMDTTRQSTDTTHLDTLLTSLEDTVSIQDTIQDTVAVVQTSTVVMDTIVRAVVSEVDSSLIEKVVDTPVKAVLDTVLETEEIDPDTVTEVVTTQESDTIMPQPVPTAEKTPVTETKPFFYAVQLAAGRAQRMPSNLEVFSDVYTVEEGGLYKFRIGYYTRLAEAVKSKNGAFSNGITDAFIVAYSENKKITISAAKKLEAALNGSEVPQASSNPTIVSAPKVVPKKQTTTALQPVKLKKKSSVYLAVQIGASVMAADPIYELAKYEHVLQLQVKVIHGKPVRYYTGETTDKDEAEATLTRVKSKGVEGAFLIGVADGKRIEYQQALDFLNRQK